MVRLVHVLIVGAVLLLPLQFIAQQAIPVDEATMLAHVTKRVDPIFPPIAKAARIVGTVVFDIRVGVNGKVEQMKVVSGPAMLQQAAIDGLKHWDFAPFQKDGIPVAATGRVSIIFSLGKDDPTPKEDEIATRYFAVDRDCINMSRSGGDLQQLAAACKRAAEIAEEFPADRRFIEKRGAFVYASWALLRAGDVPAARHYADRAVETILLGHDDNSGSNAAYSVRGMVEARQGDLNAADRDLTTAEEFERKAIDWAKSVKFEHGEDYRHSLQQDLEIHAKILQGLGRADEAQHKLDEAGKLP
jgi:TonB family protein